VGIAARGAVDEAARWDGARGVTGDASRERELGAGKWQESARSLDEVRRQMDAEPVREMEPIEASAGSWPMLAMGAVLLLLLVGLYLWATGAFGGPQVVPAG
jgi:cytochrome c-type biogenesis protein CcmH/NrfG